MSRCCLLVAIAIGAGACPRQHAPEGPAAAALAGGVAAELRLSDWKAASIDEIGYLSLGLLTEDGDTRLVVYDVRGAPPVVRTEETVIWRSEAPALEDGAYVISWFDAGNFNRLGGTFSVFEKQPSSGRATLVRRAGHLRFRYRRRSEGFVGFWIHLYDDRLLPEDRTYLHIGLARFITFEVRGRRLEDIEVRVADRAWDEKGDSLPVGRISEFEVGRVGPGGWRRVAIPIEALPDGVQAAELASLVFTVAEPGSGRVDLRNLALTRARDTPLPRPAERARKSRSLRKATWVWETARIVASEREQERLVEFCRQRGFSDVFLQLPHPADRDAGRTVEDLLPLAGLIERLHRAGVTVDALDGHPRFALAENHDEVLATARAVVAYNRSVPRRRRFDGMRFDNEPYLLPGFAGPRRERILRDYLALLDSLRRVARRAGLRLGADIPFWFDGHNRYQEPVARVDGRPVSELVLDRVDNIAIMAYRTNVYGPDGVIAHSLDEIEYAELTGKGVFVALESVSLPDERLLEVARIDDVSADGGRVVLVPGEAGVVSVHFFPRERAADADALVARQPGSVLLSPIFSVAVPASKLTFHDRTIADIAAAMERARSELVVRPSLVGFALHSYESLVEMPLGSEGDGAD